MNARTFNWPLWAGFLVTLVAVFSFFAIFLWFPVTRDFPWANLLLFAIAAGFLFVGIRRGSRATGPIQRVPGLSRR